MGKDFIDIVMNPVRQRIIQVLMIKKEATSAQILEQLEDVSRASLYRHIKVLLDAGVIQVVKEETRRGAVEKTFMLNETPPDTSQPEDAYPLIQNALLHISADFARYFAQDNPDPQKDLVSIGSAILMMNDEEYMEFLKQYGALIMKGMQNPPEEGRKPRKVTLISIPAEES